METRKTPSEKNREIFESFPDSFYTGHVPSVKKKWYYPVAAAAVLLPLIAAGLLWLNRNAEEPAAPLAAAVSYYVNEGVKGKLELKDGTKVELNSGSTLTVKGERRVFLDGEGWFEVKSDAEHPFYVETPSGIAVKVTGTQFNLSNYKDEPFKVLLVKGNIELQGEKAPARVKPSQQVVVRNGKAQKSQVSESQAKNETAWKEGVLVFDDKPFSEVIPMMERWYGVHFNVVSPELLRERLTGEFNTETLQDVMSVLSLTHKFFYNINGKEVTIAFRK